MKNPIKKLGLNFGGDEIYLSEVQFEKNKYYLSGLYRLNIDPVTTLSQIEDDRYKKEFKEILSDIIKLNEIDTADIGISIDYKMGILKKINFDPKLKDRELEEHFNWEKVQYINDDPENFLSDIDKVDTSSKKPAVVMGIASQTIIDFIKQIIPSSLDIRLIDFNIFSASNSVEINYDLSDFELSALVKIGMNKIITIFNQGTNFKGVITKFYKSLNPEDYDKISSDALQLIERGFKKYNANKDKKGIDRIFLYQGFKAQKLEEIAKNLGDDEFVNLNLSKELDESKKQKIEILNPFNKIEVSDIIKEKIDESINSVYAESVGLALKLIKKNL